MIDETVKRIEDTINQASAMEPARKQELLALVAELKKEVTSLADTHAEHAQSIAGFLQVGTHEAVREEKDETLLQHSLDGLAASVERFEATHPRLVRVVQSIEQQLRNIGLG
jgi:Mg2+ and Co2+ transporter CorA